MTNTLSATPSLPLPTVALFDRFGKPIKPTGPNEELAKHRATVRKAKHELELQAIEYARIMQQKHIEAALDPKTDPKLARQLRLDIIERGIGKVRESEPDNDPKQRDAAAQNLLDVLASFSTRAMAVEAEGKTAPRIEKDVTPGGHLDIDLSEFDAGGGDHE
ncbi:hypothetical protein D3C81_478340 [compost metagenome]